MAKRVSARKTTFLKPISAMKASSTLWPNESFGKTQRSKELKGGIFYNQCDLLNIWKISQKFIKTLLWKISFFGLFSVLSVQKIFFGVLRMTSFFSIPWNCWEISQNLWKNPNFLALFGFFEKKFLRGCPSEFSALWDFSEKKNPRKRKFYFQLIVFL